MQGFACFRLSFELGARQRLPLRRPAAERVRTIRTLAASLSEKRKLVPSGTLAFALDFAEIAVVWEETRKRECRRCAPVICGA